MKPYNTQIELVEGCNRMCEFCGIYGIWQHKSQRKIRTMGLPLAKQVAKNLGKWWEKGKRIEFAMHGEPTLHPNLLKIVSIFRKHNPRAQIQLTTNGLKLTKSLVEDLLDRGLNILMVDTYVQQDKILNVLNSTKYQDKMVDFYESGFNPYYFHSNKIQTIVVIKALDEMNRKDKKRVILNHAGNLNPKYLKKFNTGIVPAPLQKKCSRPFREIVVHWDGTIPLCCIDWKHEFIVGKFPADGSLETIWNSDIFMKSRHLLYHKERWMRPCYKCDYNGGFRLGLLECPPVAAGNLQKEITAHIAKYAKYAHPNASGCAYTYKKAGKGISKFL